MAAILWAGMAGIAIAFIIAASDELRKEWRLFKERHFKCYQSKNGSAGEVR